MPAEEHQILFFRQFFCDFLVENLPLRSQIDHARTFSGARRQGFICIVNRFRLHHHTGAAAIGRIVYMVVFVLRVIADIDRLDRDQPFVNRTPRNTCVQSPHYHLRKQGQNMKIHPFLLYLYSTFTTVLSF